MYCTAGNACATNTNLFWGCCVVSDLDNCPLATTCIDSTAQSDFDSTYLASLDVTVWCVNSLYRSAYRLLIQYSSDSTAGFCTIDILEADSYQYTGYGCYSYSVAPDTYGTTYSSGPSAANYTVTLLNAVYSPTPTLTPTTSTTPTTTNPTTPPISPTPPPPLHTPSPPVNLGPIVGGAVGGVAALAIIAILAFCLVRKSKKQTGPAEVKAPTTEQRQWQAGLAQPLSQHPPQQYGNNSWPHSQQDYASSNDTDKSPFASHTNQILSPVSQQSASDPMSYTPESGHERQSTFAPPYIMAGDSQMSGGQPMPELDGLVHNGNQRY
jgi:hypothetical protein